VSVQVDASDCSFYLLPLQLLKGFSQIVLHSN